MTVSPDYTRKQMTITVIVCTYNRCESLARALSSLVTTILGEAVAWEILVVDNNSKDQTSKVVEGFCNRYPGRFRYVFEPQQGKSYALNTAIREARGDVLAFIDDDVVVASTWLQDLTQPLHDSQWAGCGGRILPPPGFSPPRWLAVDGPLSLIGALCAFCDRGEVACELKEAPYGANMAFRKEMFGRYGYFRTDLGPRPNSEMRHEDTEFGGRLIAGGEHLCYVPSAVVYHEIHKHRVRKAFFLAWWFDFGRGSVRETERGLSIFEMIKIVARTLLTASSWPLTINPQKRFYRKCRIWFAAGKMTETCNQVIGARKSRGKLEQRTWESINRG